MNAKNVPFDDLFKRFEYKRSIIMLQYLLLGTPQVTEQDDDT